MIIIKSISVIPGKKNSAELRQIEKPVTDNDRLMIKTIRVGVDGTDKEINNAEYGKTPENEDFLIIGHEALGRVVQIGESLDPNEIEIKLNDLVVPTVRRPDNCHYCQTGQIDMCIDGNYTEHGIKGEHGFLREFFTEKPKYLIKIPNNLKDIAVLLEPLSVVEKGIRQAWKIQERMAWQPKTALILGLGSIGILGSLILKLNNLDVTIYSREETSNPKVKIINQIGISYISAQDIDIEYLHEEFDENIDFILEATGNSIVAMNAMYLVGQNGVLCLTGVTGGHKEIELCADCLNLELVLGNKVIFGTVNANRVDFEQGVKDMINLKNNFPNILEKIITDKYKPEEFQKALYNYEGLKAVIDFELK